MFTFRYGGKKGRRLSLVESKDMVAVRTYSRHAVSEERPFAAAELSPQGRSVLSSFEQTDRFREAGVEILRARLPQRGHALRDKARAILKKLDDVRFAGRVLCDSKSLTPVLYTENFFVQFDDDLAASACVRILKSYGLSVTRVLEYARNAYFAAAEEGTGLKAFDIAERLLAEPKVELCHPELIRKSRLRAAFPEQWHLKKTTINGQAVDASANVEAAWALSDGTGVTIAIIDDGVDLEHEEFRSANKIVAPRDATRKTDNPRPADGNNHGTACAGVACGDGQFHASGVAPKARLMPIRLASALGSQNEADAFVWAVQNGADVISCSWGPEDGDFTDPNDPVHLQSAPLPDATRLAMEFASTTGRNGKGCVILFAAGNGNESVDLDGYASFNKVIAIAASNDRGKKAPYSDFGNAVWCAFPSNNYFPSLTRGIWTTDRTGPVGYNPGTSQKGDAAGNYTNSFGGTSSACPGAAGVAALVLARNPELRADEVRDIFKRCCDRIDTAGGQYDANGHSPLYGFGRLNALKAVELAAPAQPSPVAIRTTVQDVPIRDLQTSRLGVAVADTKKLTGFRVTVDIEHTYIGDLVVSLQSPAAMSVAPVVLHNRAGGGTENLKRTFDVVSTPGLAAYNGKSPAGTWTLVVRDMDRRDEGRIRSISVELRF